jgi:hypothetical protein
VDFANAITIIIACSFSLPWCMADCPMDTASRRKVPLGCPLVGVDDRIIAGVSQQ